MNTKNVFEKTRTKPHFPSRERERLVLYYSRTEMLGNSLLLQSVLAKLHRHTHKDD